MTAPRNPVAHWVLETIGLIGEDGVFRATGKTVDAIRKASNPNERRSLAVADLVKLAAERATLGQEHGLDAALNAEIAREQARIGGTPAASDIVCAHMRSAAEHGDVSRVLEAAARDGKLTAPEIRQCLTELDQSIEADTRLRAMLVAAIPAPKAA